MTPQDVPTKFAPSARSPREEIERQSQFFQQSRMFREFSDAVPNILLVLNKNRQIVHANRIVLTAFGIPEESALLGLRPGEAMKCLHAFESEGGCGTTEYCRTCGAVKAILTSQRGDADVQECRIIQELSAGSLDLRITTTPFEVDGERYTVFAATDIADEKRKEALERIFFHDVLNTAGGVQGYLELLDLVKEQERDEFTQISRNLVKTLIEEIQAQQDLAAAERGDITPVPVPVDTKNFLSGLIELYRMHKVADSRKLELAPDTVSTTLTCDKRLLHRVIGNMVKNALEASKKGQTVTVGCAVSGPEVEFWVRNEECMPRDVQLQVFQRSFSTKGAGRGLGTYSIKLLGEKYLGGKVTFTSTEGDGTVFRLRLPASEH